MATHNYIIIIKVYGLGDQKLLCRRSESWVLRVQQTEARSTGLRVLSLMEFMYNNYTQIPLFLKSHHY